MCLAYLTIPFDTKIELMKINTISKVISFLFQEKFLVQVTFSLKLIIVVYKIFNQIPQVPSFEVVN